MKSEAAEGIVGGRYLVDGQLGQGGMAQVFDAFDDRLHRRVAVKILHPHTEVLPGMRKRFQQEARIAARLIHPNIVAVLDYGEDGDSCYLVMERLPGRTFRDEMATGPVPPARVSLVISETLAALAAAHKYGVLHRDIKPSNILLQEDGTHIKITDFGIAKSFDLNDDIADDVTQTGIILGTPGYLAPERRVGQAATVQSDIYSVGAVMVEALSGRRPSEGPGVLDALPAGLREVAVKALAPDPSDRFDSAEAMLAATEPYAGAGSDLPTTLLQADPATSTLPLGATSEVSAPTAALMAPPVTAAPGLKRRPPKAIVMALTAGALLLALILLVTIGGNSSGPRAAATSHDAAHHAAPDPERTAIRSLATSLASGGLPGDHALAAALNATAAQPPGATRQAAAEQAMVLASVLLSGGGISAAQYQDVVSILQATGAPAPTTTTTAPPTTVPPPAPKPGPGAHHGHDGGGPGG